MAECLRVQLKQSNQQSQAHQILNNNLWALKHIGSESEDGNFNQPVKATLYVTDAKSASISTKDAGKDVTVHLYTATIRKDGSIELSSDNTIQTGKLYVKDNKFIALDLDSLASP